MRELAGLGAVLDAIEAEHASAFCGECERGRTADASCSAGDERDFAVERANEGNARSAVARVVTVIGCVVTNADRASSSQRSDGRESRFGTSRDEERVRGCTLAADLLRDARTNPVNAARTAFAAGDASVDRSRPITTTRPDFASRATRG